MKRFGALAKGGLGAALALVSLGAPAEPDVRPGLWETTVSVQIPGMPMTAPPMTHSHCITREDLVPKDPQSTQECQHISHKIEGNTVTWNAECKHADQVTVGTGKITYAGDTYQGGMEMEMSGGPGGNMKMTQTMRGRRIGDCPK